MLKETKNKPITQVKLCVLRTLASRDLVPGPGSHQAWDLFVGIEISMLVSLLLPSGGRPEKKCVTLACRLVSVLVVFLVGCLWTLLCVLFVDFVAWCCCCFLELRLFSSLVRVG